MGLIFFLENESSLCFIVVILIKCDGIKIRGIIVENMKIIIWNLGFVIGF